MVLCGNSVGGLLAADYAASFPERAQALVVSGAPGFCNDKDVDIGVRRSIDIEIGYTLGRQIIHDPSRIPHEAVEELVRRFNHRTFQRRLSGCLRELRNYWAADMLRGVTCPTLLVWGADDHLTSGREWTEFSHQMPDAEFHEIPDCGHAPMFERPGAFNSMLLEFLERHTPIERR
jgi:pimeloyl-ACP methyl ester carboxylesterase